MGTFKAVVTGACGKVGREMIKGIHNSADIEVVGAVDVINVGQDIGEVMGLKPFGVKVSASLEDFLAEYPVREGLTLVDFTFKKAAEQNIPCALRNGLHVVMGTTGFTTEELEAFGVLAEENKVGALIAPNFSFGAVLMMKAAREISRYLDQAEIIEYHNDKKVDSPSGTAIATAHIIKENAAGNSPVPPNGSLARGAEYDGIRIHSVRLKSLVAHQEILFSGCGELLTIRHDSFSRESFVPGVLMAIRKVSGWTGVKIGLESILE
ncbi:MAG: 4-hydroxy-tetrahydrodipicolinate reductase [Clostridia bacterium]|jgi:4-hydroxy-tetrahydrodipicolinate reductase|nr:4-hydroxy-tetrahydrodipicolinate reductase [Clostridia bacterium]